MSSTPDSQSGSPAPVSSAATALAVANNRSLAMKWLIPGLIGLGFFIAGIILLLIMGSIVGPIGLVIAMIVAILPLPIYVSLVLWLDRYEAEPPHLLAMAFLWGATFSCLFSFIFNTLGGTIAFKLLSPNAANVFTAVICAPLFEEFSKGLVLFILFYWKKDEFDGIIDGIMYSTMVALGFAMTENFLYYGRGYAQAGAQGLTTIFIMRGIISPLAHPLFTSMTGIGLGITRQFNIKGVMQIVIALLGLLAAMFLHFAWNFSASFGAVFFLVYLVVMLPALVGVIGVIIYSLFQEQKVLRQHLAMELQKGVLDQADYDACCSAFKRMGVTFGAFTKGGINQWKSRMMFHQTASELAFHRHRVSRGVLGSGYTSEEREAYYIQRLMELRAVCGNNPLPVQPPVKPG